jgi:transposase/DNA-binding CsgD family transcriptional regulator
MKRFPGAEMKREAHSPRGEEAKLPESRGQRVRWEAVLMVSSGATVSEAARVHGVCQSSIRRWLRSTKRHGVGALEANPLGGRPARIDAALSVKLSTDLRRAPSEFEYHSSCWSGALVSRHLRERHGIPISSRQGRRLLAQLGPHDRVSTLPRMRRPDILEGSPAADRPKPRPQPAWDGLNKERALRKIKRLASSGLPVEPFVLALLELIQDAVPSGGAKLFLADPGDRPDAFIGNVPEIYAMFPEIPKYWVTTTSEKVSGLSIKLNSRTFKHRFLGKVAWPFEQFMLPSFYQADGFNALARPFNFHHCLVIAYQEDSQTVGVYPLWRETDQRPFSRDDVLFLNTSAPYVTHGLKIAQHIESAHDDSGEAFSPIPGWGLGVVLIDPDGRVIAADRVATSIFAGLAPFDGMSIKTYTATLQGGFDYIARTLRTIFAEKNKIESTTPPALHLYSQWTGMTLKLRGIVSHGPGGGQFFTVLVERGELVDHHRRRLMFRWGISARDLLMLESLADKKPNDQIASDMHVTKGTFKSYLKRLSDKLDMARVSELRIFASTCFSPDLRLR